MQWIRDLWKKRSFRNFLFMIAVILLLTVCSLMARVVFDDEFRNVIIPLQTFLGGLSVLTASLFGYHAATAMAEEARRKDEADRKEKKENYVFKTRCAVDMVREQAHICLNELDRVTKNHQEEKINIFILESIEMMLPSQLIDAMEHMSYLSDFPDNIRNNISQLINFVLIFIDFKKTFENRFISNVLKIEELANQRNISFPVFEKEFVLYKKQGYMLEDIHKKSIEILSLIYPEGRYNPVPYLPSENEASSTV